MTPHDMQFSKIQSKICDECHSRGAYGLAFSREAAGKPCVLTDCIISTSAGAGDG